MLGFSGWNPFFRMTYDWIQVEVTSHCNAACIYCPRTVYRDKWPNRHLRIETFRKLLPAFRRTRLVHLQGWGEPLLHPQFLEMAAMAKAAGCRVGTTTNAMLLDEERISRLVESRLDLVAVSLAGTGEENDRIRRGTRLKQVLSVLQGLKKEKERQHAQRPLIHIAYLLFSSGLDRVHELPALVNGLGVEDIVISTLDFVPSEELQAEVLRPRSQDEYGRVKSTLDEAVGAGQERGIRVHYRLPYPGEWKKECTENVGRAVCISSDGAVTPCVYTNLDIPDAEYLAGGEGRPYRRLVFGNAGEGPLLMIWRRPAYKAFRDSFAKGRLADPCRECPKR